MLEAGVVEIVTGEQADKIVDSSSSVGGLVQGITTKNGKVYIVRGNIQEGEAWAVFQNELGQFPVSPFFQRRIPVYSCLK